MSGRACPVCGMSLEGMHRSRVYCGDRCRQRKHRGAAPVSSEPRESTTWRDAVAAELAKYPDGPPFTRVSLEEGARLLDAGGYSRSEWLKLRQMLIDDLGLLEREVAARASPVNELVRRVSAKRASDLGWKDVAGG